MRRGGVRCAHTSSIKQPYNVLYDFFADDYESRARGRESFVAVRRPIHFYLKTFRWLLFRIRHLASKSFAFVMLCASAVAVMLLCAMCGCIAIALSPRLLHLIHISNAKFDKIQFNLVPNVMCRIVAGPWIELYVCCWAVCL